VRGRKGSTATMDSPRTPASGPPAGHADDLRLFFSFQHFPLPDLEKLAALGRYQELQQGQLIFTEGEGSQDFFVLLAGAVQGYHDTPQGKQSAGDLRVGNIFGETSFLDNQPRPASVVCTVSGIALRFPAEETKRLAGSQMSLQVALLRSFWHSLSVKMRLANRAMIEIVGNRRLLPRQGDPTSGAATALEPSAKVKLFREQGLAAAELRLLAATLPSRKFGPDDFIFVEGQEADALYIVVDGGVRISRRIPGMGEEALAIFGRGEIFGEMALIDDQRRSADAIAHSDGCLVLVVSKSDIEEIVALNSNASIQFLRLLCQMLCRRLRAMIKLLVNWRILVGPVPE
jgi:CRP/FNR family cyclic AMP-dependent transcriptional regulator